MNNFIEKLKSRSPLTVSYTHLDVYKRQQILFTLYMLIPMSWQEEQAHMMLRKRPGAM